MVELCRNIRFSNSYIDSIKKNFRQICINVKIVHVYKYTSSVDL